MSAPAALLIGVIADTHGLLRPEAVAALGGCDHIIHAGDIGRPEVIEQLSEIAPVSAIRGNVDKGDWATVFPQNKVVAIAGRHLYLLHNARDLDLDPRAAGFDCVISGHSHKPSIEARDGVLFVNPGSAGPRRFKLPIAVATIALGPEPLALASADIIVLNPV